MPTFKELQTTGSTKIDWETHRMFKYEKTGTHAHRQVHERELAHNLRLPPDKEEKEFLESIGFERIKKRKGHSANKEGYLKVIKLEDMDVRITIFRPANLHDRYEIFACVNEKQDSAKEKRFATKQIYVAGEAVWNHGYEVLEAATLEAARTCAKDARL